jgi:hypothetical protein
LDLFELLFCGVIIRMEIWVILPRHLSIGLADILSSRCPRDPEHLVIVVCHLCSIEPVLVATPPL